MEPEHTQRFGVAEVHAVWFEPDDDRGEERPAVAVQIPETPRSHVRRAMKMATQLGARVMFLCDTVEQANRIATRASVMLPKHRRISMERVRSGGWGERWA